MGENTKKENKIKLIREVEIKDGYIKLYFAVDARGTGVPSSTVSPYDSYFHWVIKNKLKYIPEDEFDSLRNKYRAKLKRTRVCFW